MELVRARQNGGEISNFLRAETTSFHRPKRCAPCAKDVPQNFPKLFHNTPRLKRVFYVTRLYAAAGISRYRRINVAPSASQQHHYLHFPRVYEITFKNTSCQKCVSLLAIENFTR